MGDRVYSNETEKYYSVPGMNEYVMNSTVDIAGAAGNAPSTVPVAGLLSFTENSPSVRQFPDICTIINGSGIAINEAGMYCIKLLAGVVDPNNPTTVDVDLNIKMTLTRSGDALNGLVLDESQCRFVAAGASPGSTVRVISLSCTGFFKKDDEINITLQNYSAGIVRVLDSQCQLMVSKIY